MNKVIRNSLLKLGGLVLAGVIGLTSIYRLDQTEHAVITSFGNPTKVIVNAEISHDLKLDTEKLKAQYASENISYSEGAGLKLKWPWERINRIDKRVQRWDGWPRGPTRDKKNIWIDTTARFYISNPLTYYRTMGNEQKAQAKLSDIIDSEQRTAITGNNLIEIIRSDNRAMEITEAELRNSTEIPQIQKGRAQIISEISDKSKAACSEYGIGIHPAGVLIKGISYVESVKTAVEQRMQSERTRIAERYRSEGNGEYEKIMGQMNKIVKTTLSEGYKSAREIEGLADAEATAIYANGFVHQEKDAQGNVVKEYKINGLNSDPEFYEFVRCMGLYETGLGGKDKTNVFIGTGNPIMKFLKGEYAPQVKTKE